MPNGANVRSQPLGKALLAEGGRISPHRKAFSRQGLILPCKTVGFLANTTSFYREKEEIFDCLRPYTNFNRAIS